MAVELEMVTASSAMFKEMLLKIKPATFVVVPLLAKGRSNLTRNASSIHCCNQLAKQRSGRLECMQSPVLSRHATMTVAFG